MSESVELCRSPPSHHGVPVDRVLAFESIPPKKVYASQHNRQELLRRTGQDQVLTSI